MASQLTTAPTSRQTHPGGGIPAVVQQWVERAVGSYPRTPESVRIIQIGDIWRAPGAQPLHFRAVEELATHTTAFSWRATFPLAPFVAVRIHDGLDEHRAWMDGHVLGVPFMRHRSPSIRLAATLRYLAELAWAPHAAIANRALRWRQVDTRIVEVSLETAGDPAVTYTFDTSGDIAEVTAPSRPRDGDGPRPWGGRFGSYAVVGGLRIPTTADVWWDLPAGRFTYFRCAVTGAALLT